MPIKTILEKLEQEVDAAHEEEHRKSLSDRERLRRIMESEEMSDTERQAYLEAAQARKMAFKETAFPDTAARDGDQPEGRL